MQKSMQKSIWKLAALAGVVGVGSLGVMQAQRGMNRKNDEAVQEKPFENFEAEGELGEASDSVAGKKTDDMVGFGQFEPGSGSTTESADASDGFTVVKQKSDTPSSDPFADQSSAEPESKSEFASLPPRARKRLEDDDAPSAGLDFRTAAAEPEPIAEMPEKASRDTSPEVDDDPFGLAADDFQPSKAAPKQPADDPFAPAEELDTPAAADEEVRLADGDSDKDDPPVRQTAELKQEPSPAEFGDDQGDDPFAADGPRLFAPAANARPLKEARPQDEPAPLESIRQRRPKRRPIAIAERPLKSESPKKADNPFAEPPTDDTPEIKPQEDAFSAFDDVAGTKENAPTEEKEVRPTPEFGALEDEPPMRRQPTLETPPADEFPSNDDDTPIPAIDPFGDSPEPVAEKPADRNRPEPKAADSEPVPEPEPEPEATDEPPALKTAPLLSPPMPESPSAPAVEDRSAETADPQPVERPGRLRSQPKSIRLVPPTDDDLAGDATVRADAPRGPQRPQLSILKQAPPNAVLGKPMIYSIIVKNVGNSPAAQVTVEDRIPRGTRLTGTIPQAEMYNKKLIWKIGTLRPQEQRKIQVRVIPHSAGQIGSIATVNFVAEVSSRTMVTSPSIKLHLASPTTANVGGQFTMKFKVTNDGTSNATGVVLRNLIPTQLSHPGGRDLEYDVGNLQAGQSKEVSLQLTAAKIGKAVNKAVVTADGDLTAEAIAAVDIVGPQLELTRSGPKKRYLGRPAKYVNRVTNTSNVPVGPVTVVESIPSGMKFVRATQGGQFNQAERTIAWRINRLAPGATAEVASELTAMSKGSQVSRVTAAGPNGKLVRVQSQTAVTGLAVLSANLTGITGPIPVGETVTLKVRVANRGNRPATGVRVQLALPSELEFVTSEGAVKATAGSNGVQFSPLQEISPQQEQTLTIVLRATRPNEETHLKVLIDADQLSRPLSRDDVLAIIGDSP